MAYVYSGCVINCVITFSAKTADGRELNVTHIFTPEVNGQEVTNQIADTVLSALHLADAVRLSKKSKE